MKYDFGDLVQVHYEDELIEGILIKQDADLIIKLDSGYNIALDLKKVKKIELIEKKEDKSHSKTEELKHNKALKNISILHTGGTIASRVDYKTGGVISRYSPEELVEMFPELKTLANIKSRLISNMWSEDMRFSHYNILAKEIEKEIKSGANGIIITHGTDTLHYSSAALRFSLENLPIPVILVGSQRSSDRGSSDAAINLLSAVYFIANQNDFADVGVCMHENLDDNSCVILPGTKCRKMHSSRRDAFKAINGTPWARIDFKQKKIEILSNHYSKPAKEKFNILLFKESLKIAILKIHTNMHAEQFSFFQGYDGLVIEGMGLAGNIPINETDVLTKEHAKIADAIGKLIKNGTILAASTQTIYGRINMNVYTTGRKMQELGIIGNYSDMTPETAFIKLAWLLSNFDKKEIKELFEKNLRGETSERIEQDEYLAD